MPLYWKQLPSVVLVWLVTTLPVRGQECWLVYKHAKGGARVEAIMPEKSAPAKGLAIWHDGASERWQMVPAGWRVPAGVDEATPPPVTAPGATRSVALTGSSSHEFGQMTLQLDQLRGAVATRDLESSFLTPARDSVCLSGKITIRRMKQTKGIEYQAGVAELTALPSAGKAKRTWKLLFAEGQSKRAWQDLTELAKELPDGLHPGHYELRMGKKEPTRFEVESLPAALKVLQPIREAEALLSNQRDPLLVAFVYDHLVGQLDEKAVPRYLADALDFLERQPDLPVNVQKQHEILLNWLYTPPQTRAEAVRSAQANQEQPLGIEDLDQARGLLERGNRDAAAKTLRRVAAAKTSKRAAGLANLYLGVLYAEGSASEKAEEHFAIAAVLLAAESLADRLRLHNNRADYLHQHAQDSLYNHSLRAAAGVERPIGSVLVAWSQALEEYSRAIELADAAKQPGQRSAIALNLARHHALLADFVRSLDTQKSLPELAEAADVEAQRWIDASLKVPQKSPLLQGMGKELRAQLAYRQAAKADARKLAQEAQAHYLEIGFLAGVENLQRLQALTATSSKEALQHYRMSSLISESLRQRMPADRIGATQAGFFARKAWVFDKMVELLLKEGNADEALRMAELARARTLQDYLPRDAEIADTADQSSSNLASVLAKWPADAVGLEYFLGAEQAYVFFVNAKGKVRAIPLVDAEQRPLASRVLVADVQRFLQGIEGQSGKMYQRVLAKQGFDHTWQDDLHTLYQSLVPADVRKEVGQAKTTIIVPQHILHYFPFQALVTQRDPKERSPKEMVTPRFWIDEPGVRLMTPSLTLWHSLRSRPLEPITQVSAIGLVEAPGADRLEGVEKDLLNLKSAFGSKVRLVVEGDKATVSAVTQTLKQPGMLFFATHGHNDGERPLQSYLLLMPAADKTTPDERSGRLTAQTVFQTKVSPQLIVMSACYSGLGDRSPAPGDDLFGMQRAFLQSGSRAVVAGLWDVYDGTAPELMNGFFTRFAKGDPVAEALQGSQRDFLAKLRTSGKSQPYLHPYFWSVYTVIGDERVGFARP